MAKETSGEKSNDRSNQHFNARLNFRYFALWIMVSIYPLVVIPQLGFAIPRYVLLALVSLLAFFFFVRDRLKLDHPAFIPLAFFIGFSLISTFLAQDPSTAWVGSFYRMTGFTTFAFCAILLAVAYHCERIEKILVYMIVCAAVVSVVAVLQHFGLNIITEGYSKRPYGTIGNSNWLGTYLVFILPASILLFLRNRKLSFLLYMALIYAGLLVCVTRGTWLAFMVVFALITFYVFAIMGKAKRKSFTIVLLTMLIVTCLLLPTNDGIIIKRFLSIPNEMVSAVQLKDSAGSNRIYIWKETLQLIKENWAFGVGPDHLSIKMPSGRIMDKAHNIYLEIAVTMGVFALFSYLVFLSFFLRLSYCKDELGFVFFVMIFTYLLQGLFNNDVIMVLPLFWIVLGLSLASARNPTC